jgi:hypothetical protein
MARQYAVGSIPYLAGQVVTSVAGMAILPGSPLPEGTEKFNIAYFYTATAADVEAGAEPGQRIAITIDNVSVNASAAQIRNAIMELRAEKRAEQDWRDSDPLGATFK